MAPELPLSLYLASTNRGKLRELSAAASDYGIAIEPLPNLQILSPCLEDGGTFEENARKKALHYSQGVDGLLIAEDSGLSVHGLGGAPGVFSARFAGPRANDAANNAKLLEELSNRAASPNLAGGSGELDRSARYTCVMALAKRGRILTIAEGRADGVILDSPRGSGGFGYDPLFFYPPLGKTFAELTPQEKFRVSHRGEAFRRLVYHLKPSE